MAADRSIVLRIDTDMNIYDYSVQGDGKLLKIQGGSASSVLCGA